MNKVLERLVGICDEQVFKKVSDYGPLNGARLMLEVNMLCRNMKQASWTQQTYKLVNQVTLMRYEIEVKTTSVADTKWLWAHGYSRVQ